LAAFRDLLFSGTYDAVTVAALIKRADVGRSTFYEHFENKEALFRESLSPLLTILAMAVSEGAETAAIQSVVEHFWENRRLVRSLFAGPARNLAAEYLGDLIEAHLRRARKTQSLPVALVGRHIAESQLGLLLAWVTSPVQTEPAEVAAALIDSSRALARS
jgi:AcrR family transcriptional regulator